MKLNIAIVSTLLSMWIGGGAYIAKYYCCIEAPIIPLLINDGVQPVSAAPDNLMFSFSVPQAEIPESVSRAYSDLLSHMAKHPDKKLLLTGKYTALETNTSAFANLGMARAEGIKAHLMELGMSADRIETAGEEDLKMVFINKQSSYGMSYTISDPPVDQQLLDAKALLEKGPLTLLFAHDHSNVNSAEAQQVYLDALKYYLQKHPNTAIQITGHTDFIGSAIYNQMLGEKRSGAAKQWLTQNGISPELISLNSKGETEPAFENTTEEGRAKNRRVENCGPHLKT